MLELSGLCVPVAHCFFLVVVICIDRALSPYKVLWKKSPHTIIVFASELLSVRCVSKMPTRSVSKFSAASLCTFSSLLYLRSPSL